jgi:hypothetical protein
MDRCPHGWRYWPNVFLWAERVGEPWPKRTAIWLRQGPSRITHWWYGHEWKAALESPKPAQRDSEKVDTVSRI